MTRHGKMKKEDKHICDEAAAKGDTHLQHSRGHLLEKHISASMRDMQDSEAETDVMLGKVFAAICHERFLVVTLWIFGESEDVDMAMRIQSIRA